MKAKSKIYTHHALLRDLKEIKAILDVEFQLRKELARMAIARQTVTFGF
jgi:hypothetical protein